MSEIGIQNGNRTPTSRRRLLGRAAGVVGLALPLVLVASYGIANRSILPVDMYELHQAKDQARKATTEVLELADRLEANAKPVSIDEDTVAYFPDAKHRTGSAVLKVTTFNPDDDPTNEPTRRYVLKSDSNKEFEGLSTIVVTGKYDSGEHARFIQFRDYDNGNTLRVGTGTEIVSLGTSDELQDYVAQARRRIAEFS